MRVERDEQTGHPAFARAQDDTVQHVAMAEMNAVERPNGYDGAVDESRQGRLGLCLTVTHLAAPRVVEG